MTDTRPKDPHIPLLRQLSFRAFAGTVCFLVLVPLAVYVSMQTKGRQALSQQAEELNSQIGQKIVLKLGERIKSTEAFTRSLANLAESLPREESIYHDLIPPLMSGQESSELIAGGGIWPEPNMFEEGTERRSFFWARNDNGIYEYLDDYNDLNGAGYHNEEWYAPARYLKPGQIFWSKSYMDPYSLEPMVTCTVPYWINGSFAGVATVDLRLQGISEFMAEQAKGIGGYAFAVDRNNKLLSFPDPALGKHGEIDSQGRRVEEYLDVKDVAPENESFATISKKLDELDKLDSGITEIKGSSEVQKLANKINEDSYQIDTTEALRIATNILKQQDVSKSQFHFRLEDDLILNEETYISLFSVPSTFWKVAIAMPARYTDSTVAAMTNEVALSMVITVLAICVFMYLFFEYQFIRPVRNLSGQLRSLALDKDYSKQLDIESRDELSKLAYWYNIRSSMLGETMAELETKNVQLEEARKAAEAASRSKNIFLASMSHEIRTPMNGIIGLTGLLKDMEMEEEQASFVETISTSAESLLLLINDILDYSKIEANELDLEEAPFDIRNVLEELTDLISFQAQHKGLQFSCYLNPTANGHVIGDSGRLRQILLNLVSNALKFTERGEINIWGSLESESDDDCVYQFNVKDTGIGIPDTAFKKLFNSFSQVDSSTTRKYGGTGLGLAICKRLSELMGGTIFVSSKLGEGSCFSFTVRLKKNPNYSTSKEGKTPGKQIDHAIIIDDEANHGEVLSAQLSEFGITTTHFKTKEAAIAEALKTAKNTLVLVGRSNNSLPGSNYSELKNAFSKSSAKLVRFAGITTEKSSEPEPKWDGLLSKPFKRSQLSRLLLDLFSNGSSPNGRKSSKVNHNTNSLFSKFSVLIVEDNSVNQKVAVRLLRRLGIEPKVASDGEKALALIKLKKFDIILMDWQMPVMDGLEATRKMRKLGGHHSHVPVIALTANAMQGDRDSCLKAGMNDYLSKPIRSDQLKDMLEKWLKN